MNLYDETKRLWTPDKVTLSSKWAQGMRDGLPALKQASALFRGCDRLRFYVSVGSLSKARVLLSGTPKVHLSVRHRGQEVATLKVKKRPHLVVTADHEAVNARHFKVATPAGTFPWESKQAKEFRRQFSAAPPGTKVGIPEHEYEALILEELEKKSAAGKFGGTLANVRHCGPSKREYPVQYPVPISASQGIPVSTPGHIDILVRRGPDRRLCVWEVKSPSEFSWALAQAYIYAVCLTMMLRAPGGDVWYRNFGFRGKVPGVLVVEAAVLVTPEQDREVEKALQGLKDCPLYLPEERARISLHALYYDPASLKSGSVKVEEEILRSPALTAGSKTRR